MALNGVMGDNPTRWGELEGGATEWGDLGDDDNKCSDLWVMPLHGVIYMMIKNGVI